MSTRWPKNAEPNPTDAECICPHVDIGVGVMQHAVDPECPSCSPGQQEECSCDDWRVVAPSGWPYSRWYGRMHPLIVDYPSLSLLAPPHGFEINIYCPLHGA